MSRKHIDFITLKKVVNLQGEIFTTKDVSEDPRTKAANQKYLYHSHYHSFVGGALSDHRAELNIVEIQKGTPRGSRWKKAGSFYGADFSKNFTRAQSVNVRSSNSINSLILNQNSIDYALEQINREIHALNIEIEKLQKHRVNNFGCGCFSILISIALIVFGILLISMGIVIVSIALFLIAIFFFLGGLVMFSPSSEINFLKKRIMDLKEKKKKILSN